MYRLHSFCQSGNAFKVAFALRALGQPWEPVFVDFMNGQTRTPEWREQANEMGEVPVLDDGPRRLTQTGVILTYLAAKHGALGGNGEDEQREVLRWLFFDNHKFTSHFATYRFMKAFGPKAPDPAVMAFLRGRLDASFAIDGRNSRVTALADIPTVLDQLFGDPEQVDRLTAAARSDASARFSVDRAAGRLADIYSWASSAQERDAERTGVL